MQLWYSVRSIFLAAEKSQQLSRNEALLHATTEGDIKIIKSLVCAATEIINFSSCQSKLIWFLKQVILSGLDQLLTSTFFLYIEKTKIFLFLLVLTNLFFSYQALLLPI